MQVSCHIKGRTAEINGAVRVGFEDIMLDLYCVLYTFKFLLFPIRSVSHMSVRIRFVRFMSASNDEDS